MKKFGDFIKIQTESIKQQQDKIASLSAIILKYDSELV